MLSGAPPNTDDASRLPASYQAAIATHNGMTFPDDSGYYFAGLCDGEVASNYNDDFWSSEHNDPSIDPTTLECAIEFQSTFILWHPKAITVTGEPALAILDHENGELEAPLSLAFGVGGVFLRLLGHSLLGDDERCRRFRV